MKITIEDAGDQGKERLQAMLQAEGMKWAIEAMFTELRKEWKYREGPKAGYAAELRDFLAEELRDNNVTVVD